MLDPVLRVPAAGWPGGIALGLEYVKRPVVRELIDEETTIELNELDDVLAAHLGGAYRRGRFAVGLQTTLYPFYSGEVYDPTVEGGKTATTNTLALGDTYVWVPIDILVPGDDGGFALSVVPTVGLPTGTRSAPLTNGSFLVGGRLAADWTSPRLRVGASAGFDQTGVRATNDLDPQDAGPDWSAGGLVRAEGSAQYQLLPDRLSVGAEARLTRASSGQTPLEWLATSRVRVGERLMFTAAGGWGIIPGVGSPTARAFLTASYVPAIPEPVVIEPDGPDEPQVIAANELRITDPQGNPVRGAAVAIGEVAIGDTDVNGHIALPDPVPPGVLSVLGDGFQALELDAIPEGATTATLPLVWTPIDVYVRVTGPDGDSPDAQIALVGPSEAPKPEVDDVGTRRYQLQPGEWTLTVDAEGFGKQERVLVAEPGRREAVRVDAVLTEAVADGVDVAFQVVSPDGRAVEDASIQLGEALLGTAGSGGRLTVSQVAPGAAEVRVQSPSHPDAVVRTVELTRGANAVPVELGWAPGSVKVTATGPQGRPVDGLVAFAGPTTLPPAQLGADGIRVVTLRPGAWNVIVTSPTLGVQQRRVVVDDTAVLREVSFVLQATEGGAADLALRVLDPDGQPVAGASLELDGQPLGLTTSTGHAELLGLMAGERQVQVSHPDFRASTVSLALVDGRQRASAVLGWKGGSVRVYALGKDGLPVDAMVALSGPGTAPAPTPLGDDGSHLFRLEPGDWQLVATNPEFGVQTRKFAIPDDYDRLIAIGLGMYPRSPDGGAVEVDVSGPEGQPVAGAEVWVDGFPIGTAVDGTLKAESIGVGKHEIRAVAEGYSDGVLSVTVANKDAVADADVALDWGVGALRVEVGGTPDLIANSLIGVAGPRVLPPAAPDASGQRLFQVDPGKWFVLVSSPLIGPQQEQVDVPTEPGLTTVNFDVGAEPADTGAVLLWVEDTEGQPIADVGVLLDGTEVGRTSPAGVQLVRGLKPGPVKLQLDPPLGVVAQDLEFDVLAGSQERFATLQWTSSPVTVRVRGPEGDPIDAVVLFEGSTDVDDAETGPDGELTVDLRPGEWLFRARADELKPENKTVLIQPDGPNVVEFELTDPSKGTITSTAVEIQERVQFDLDSANLSEASDELLDQVARLILTESSIVRIEVQGHTDDTGGAAYNQDLSERRAQAVKAALIDRGVPPEKLQARGYGLLRPLSPNTDETSRAANRRVEFVITERAQ